MNKFYTTLFILSGNFLALNADAQNVRAIQTSVNPQPRQINSNPVIVIQKKENNNQQQNTNREKQQGNPGHGVHKVENQNQGGDNRKREVQKPNK